MQLFVGNLSIEEHEQVDRLARSSDAITYRRAQMILLSSRKVSIQQISESLGVCTRTVRNAIHAFEQDGAKSIPHKKAPGVKRRFDNAARNALVELLRRPPAEFGFEHSLWTLQDLAEAAVREGIVPAATRFTVARELKKAGYRWQRAKRWSTSPDPDYTRKRGSSSV